MKKALLILLALTMIMSMTVLAPITASAAEEGAVGSVAADYKPEGTAVSTAEEFAKMDAAGKYYLAADITVSETYTNDFTGVFDGNGHTINTTTTLFLKLNGTVKNLTMTGAIEDAEQFDPKYSSVLARTAAFEGNVVIDNVCNKASMKSQFNGMGSMVGRGANGSEFTLTITNSANYGSITTYFAASANNDSGGFVASFNGTRGVETVQLTIENCANYGVINAYGRPGGILGNSDTSTIIKNCVNNGAVQAIDNYCGGIAGRIVCDGNTAAVVLVENCVNNADINYNGTKTAQIGGMVGYLGNGKTAIFKNCTNNGNITAVPTTAATRCNLGGMVGAGKNDKVAATNGTLTFENCVNTGNVTVKDWNGVAIVSGMLANGVSHQNIIFKNCINSGDVTANNNHSDNCAAGMLALLAYDATMTNCINTGDITGMNYVGGLIAVANINTSKGTFKSLNKYKHDLILTGCGNSGNIVSDNRAGGLVGYEYAGTNRGAVITYCFNSGNVKSNGKWASGFVGYFNAGVGKISHSYVGGKIESTIAATPIPADNKVDIQTEYTFEAGGVNYYFYAPVKGTVTISGTTVTIAELTAGVGTAADAANGGTAVKGSFYKFVYGTDTYYFCASENGAIAINGKTVKVADKDQAVTKVASTNVQVFDHRINSRALVWSNNLSFDIDESTIIIEEGAAGIDYVMGAANAVNCLGGMSDSMTKYTHDRFVSGEVANTLNTLAGNHVFFQNLLPAIFVVDEYPTTDATHAKVMVAGTHYTNQLFEMNPDITPATGDATVYVVVALGVSAVALAGLAISKKRKVRN